MTSEISVSHFRTVATATLNSPDHTVRTLSELLLQAAHQLERHEARRREANEMIGRLSAQLGMIARRSHDITTGRRVDL